MSTPIGPLQSESHSVLHIMTPEPYYKELKDLTIEELYCYGVLVNVEKSPVAQRTGDIIRAILQKEKTFLDDGSRKFYFIKDENELKFFAAPSSPTKFQKRSISLRNQVSVEILKEEIAHEDTRSDTCNHRDIKTDINSTIYLYFSTKKNRESWIIGPRVVHPVVFSD